uniref:C2H2-type domain-containing protein n=1 Tax=Steinernema glaseri TaxID=37863 RepID=A0A1I7ZER4_9BILA
MEEAAASDECSSQSKGKRYKCCYCIKSYVTPSKLEIHVRHNHMLLYACKVCDVKFNTAPELRKHNSSLHWKTYSCDFPKCAYTHPKKYMVERHTRQVHDIRRNIFCDIEGCNIHFAKCKRKQHYRDCHPDSPITASFMQSQSSKDASPISPSPEVIKDACPISPSPEVIRDDSGAGETGDRTRSESSNDSAASTSSETVQYRNRSIFDNEVVATLDSIKCSRCGKMYRSRNGLTRHILIVHEKNFPYVPRERKYVCSVSGCVRNFRTFTEKDDHEHQHKGGEPRYSCNWCDLKYHARRQLAYHLQSAHNSSIKNIKAKENDHSEPVDATPRTEGEHAA